MGSIPARRAKNHAFITQRIEYLSSKQRVGGSNPSGRAIYQELKVSQFSIFYQGAKNVH